MLSKPCLRGGAKGIAVMRCVAVRHQRYGGQRDGEVP